MDTSTDDTATLMDELSVVTEMIRARTKRQYKDAEILWRLSAKQEQLVQQLQQRHPQRDTHND